MSKPECDIARLAGNNEFHQKDGYPVQIGGKMAKNIVPKADLLRLAII